MAEGDRERWDAPYRAGAHADPPAPTWLERLDRELPRAGRALEIGLVNRIVAREDLLPTALATADAIAANAPLAVRATRRGVREIVHLPLAEAYRRQEEIGAPLRRTDDAREAQRAFVEKRRPVWRGR